MAKLARQSGLGSARALLVGAVGFGVVVACSSTPDPENNPDPGDASTSSSASSSGTSGTSGSSGTSSGSSGTSSGSSGDGGGTDGSSSGSTSSGGTDGGGGDGAGPGTHSDGIQNQGETDIDCGGIIADAVGQAPRCDDGKKCVAGNDCKNLVCNPGTLTCAAPTANDGVKNGTETGVDCGGPGAIPRCPTNEGCVDGTDCIEKVCGPANTCLDPAPDDGVKNGDETDVDCGGAIAPGCAPGKDCQLNTDCGSGGCNDLKKCSWGRSCQGRDGGRTCGATENIANHEDCCTRVDVPALGGAGKWDIPAFSVDKYFITAGRMRIFLDAIDGKVRDWITANAPAWWDPAWTPYMPNAWDGTGIPAGEHINIWSTYAQVSGGIIDDQPANQGCWIGSSYGHPTYLVPRGRHMKNGVMVDGASNLYGDDYNRWMTQANLDARPLNCSSYLMFAALCAYDGGEVISEEEVDYLYDMDGTPNVGGITPFPWGTAPLAGGTGYLYGNCAQLPVGPATSGFTCTSCPTCVTNYINWSGVYQNPLPPAGNPAAPRDNSYFISPPGRFPLGASRVINGERVQDIAGLMIHGTRTPVSAVNRTLTFGNDDPGDDVTVNIGRVRWRGGSFEGHGINSRYNFTLLTKYGKMGTRCVYR
ncbi:MAG: hypothetical protein R3B36_25585 [Polyangiaceae bacterium]